MMIVCVLLASCFTALMFYRMVLPLVAPVTSSSLELLDDDLKELEELVNLKLLLMSNLNELELDLELEKITKEDYTQLKRRAQRQIISIVKQLDGIHGGRGWEEKIEEELLRRRSSEGLEDTSPNKEQRRPEADTVVSKSAVVLKSAVASKDSDVPNSDEHDCPECGNSVRVSAKFCDECAHPMPIVNLTQTPQAQEINQ